MTRPIRRLLVANRGEIACRVIRTAHAWGIETVAVYAPPDCTARHVRVADLSIPLVGSSVAETYLDIAQVTAAAIRAGADAVHPGYGFLAENADFARAVVDGGLVWVGPRPETVEAMGSKLRAKQIARECGVPVAPSAEMVGDDPTAWAAAATDIGFPLLVKASAGGGGRGMRVAHTAEEVPEAVRAARREAHSAFGDPTVFVEHQLSSARHVEVQVFGDEFGAVLHLGERECSIQRRHQKVIEEAPSPGITPETRDRLLTGAVALAQSVGYVGAGTVEFLVSGSEAYFLEMNTRLQVEHPVTEAVTGLDLVALQLHVAEGRPLPMSQDQVRVTGHAIEARVCAEDPAQHYLPSSGSLSHLSVAPDVRWDGGYDEGDQVSSAYDSLLGKAISHGEDRARAIAQLSRALRGTTVHGIRTNLAMLAATLEHPDFEAAATPTDFLDRHPELVSSAVPEDVRAAHAAAAEAHDRARRRERLRIQLPAWGLAAPGWRNVPTAPSRDHAEMAPGVSGNLVDLEVDGMRSTYVVTAEADSPDETEAREVWVSGRGWTSCLVVAARYAAPTRGAAAGGPTAPLPGTVTAVLVDAGADVRAGDVLVVLEAMKMEHQVTADTDGVVQAVHVGPGDAVEAHQVLVTLT